MRSLALAALVLAACKSSPPAPAPSCRSEAPPAGTLLRPDGAWLVPAGAQAEAGGQPMAIAALPDGTALVLNDNLTSGGVSLVAPGAAPNLLATYGGLGQAIALSADAATVYVAGGALKRVVRFARSAAGLDEAPAFGPTDLAYPVQLALSASRLGVSEEQGASVAILDAATGTLQKRVAVGPHPWSVAFSPDGATLYATTRGDGGVHAITAATGLESRHVVACRDAAALAVSATTVYVACPGDDTVLALDPATLATRATAKLDGMPSASGPLLYGALPSALALDGDRVYAALSGEDAIAVFDASTLALLGEVPTGWYPTALSFGGGKLWVANERRGLRPNRFGAGQVVTDISGTASAIALPLAAAALAAGAAAVAHAQCEDLPPPAPPDGSLRALGKIKHVVFMLRENKTLDAELGDLSPPKGQAPLGGGDDPQWDEHFTPVSHDLARKFAVYEFHLDNEVSVLGYHWSLGALAPDYLERTWTPCYRGDRPCDDADDFMLLKSGYLIDAARAKGLAVHVFGGLNNDEPKQWGDVYEPGYDASNGRTVKDVDRAQVVVNRIAAWTQAGAMPDFVFLRLPNDGAECNADCAEGSAEKAVIGNDVATGMVASALSRSPFWSDTALYIAEDDPQPGFDHVDAYRSFVIAISPYAKRGCQSRTRASWPSLLRAIELSLDLPPMTRNDQRAEPLADCFDDAAFDATPWSPPAP